LALLGRWGDAYPDRTTTVFLGDNVYPAGLQDADRAHGEAVLRQLLHSTRAAKLFIPGNHDWGFTGVQRLAAGAVQNQQAFLEAHTHLNAAFQPKNGCPGPVAVELLPTNSRLRRGLILVVVDLHWWLLEERDRPLCDGITDTAAFLERVRAILEARREENVVVVAHHPVRSGGPHGGFTRGFWKDIGAAIFYRLYTVQDMVEPAYREMVRVLSKAMAEHPPLAMAAGHDHNLQILDGGDIARLVIVSGAATPVTCVTRLEETLFAHAHRGFVVLDFYGYTDAADGTLLAHVVETGRGDRPVFSAALSLRREEPAAEAGATPQPAQPSRSAVSVGIR
jgi:hypothetical protein